MLVARPRAIGGGGARHCRRANGGPHSDALPVESELVLPPDPELEDAWPVYRRRRRVRHPLCARNPRKALSVLAGWGPVRRHEKSRKENRRRFLGLS